MRTLILMHKYLSQVSHDITLKDYIYPHPQAAIGRFKAHYWLDVLTNIWVQTFTRTIWLLHLRIKIMWCDQRFWNGRGGADSVSTLSVVKPQGPVKIKLSAPSDTLRRKEEADSPLFLSVYLYYQTVILLGREEGEATKGCKLIRFLSLHAPLPVLLLLLSNPGGQRCAAQRLDSQTQRGNNWYKQQKLYQSFRVTRLPLSPTHSFSQRSFSPTPNLLTHCCVSSVNPFVLSQLLLDSRVLSFTNLITALFFVLFLDVHTSFLFSSVLISFSCTTTSSCCPCLTFFCFSVPTLNQAVDNDLYMLKMWKYTLCPY